MFRAVSIAVIACLAGVLTACSQRAATLADSAPMDARTGRSETPLMAAGVSSAAADAEPSKLPAAPSMFPSALAAAGHAAVESIRPASQADDAGVDELHALPSTPRSSLGDTPLPCELQSVLRASCQSCHARTPGAGAPMALITREDFLAAAVTRPERKVYELVLERVHSSSAPMPPSPQRRLVTQELALFDAQLTADLASGPDSCDDARPLESASAGKVAYPAPDPAEIDRCYPLLAHGVSGTDDQSPFHVPSGESHACFVFDVPWSGDVQAVSIRSRQSTAVHHWLLSDHTGDIQGGSVLPDRADCNLSAHKIFAVSAVNQQSELNMPPGVGLQMPAGGGSARMMLGMHYFNTGEPVDDTSGAEICVARAPRPQTASITELGVSLLNLPPHRSTDVSSTCRPSYNGEIHIIRAFPHMHARGVRLDTIIQRASGARETLIDVPFSFENQIAYDVDQRLQPGDRMLTTCHFDNMTNRTILGGESSDDEMCINFVTAWPAGSLVTSLPFLQADSCN